MKQIFYSKASLKVLYRLPATTSKLIRSKIEAYATDPTSLANNVMAMKGEDNLFRLRVGDWRVVFIETADAIEIEKVGARGGVYQ